jgi:hypothetical protein
MILWLSKPVEIKFNKLLVCFKMFSRTLPLCLHVNNTLSFPNVVVCTFSVYSYYSLICIRLIISEHFISDLWQVCSFLRVLRFPPPIKLAATI